MNTVTFEVSKYVAAAPDRVWAVIADYARDREWRAGVEMRQDPPGRAVAGAITHERMRFFGAAMRVVAKVEHVEEGRRLTFRTIESDVPVTGERRVEPSGDGSRVCVRLDLQPSGLWALFARPLGAIFRGRFARDLNRLAALVEGSA